MEIEKLMIGDFISYNDKIWNVQFINSFSGLIRKEKDVNVSIIVNKKEAKPILLTHDFLLNNHFEHRHNKENHCDYYHKLIDRDIILIVKSACLYNLYIERFKGGGLNNYIVNYVHELQHCLNLFDINYVFTYESN